MRNAASQRCVSDDFCYIRSVPSPSASGGLSLIVITKFRTIVLLAGAGWTASLATDARAQGVLQFANAAPGVNAPFYGSDGTNRLAGSRYSAALYVSPATASPSFVQAGSIQPFQTGGYWLSAFVTVPFPPGALVRVQVRFWDRDSTSADTFEQAESDGAEIGVADVGILTLNPNGLPTPLFGLQSSSLIPTLTLSRGFPRIATNDGSLSSGSQLATLCGVEVGTNRWFRLTSPTDGTAVLNTDGSAIDTVLTAFTGSIASLASLAELACNDDRAPGNPSSAVNFPVQAGVLYLICIAGKDGASGAVRLNYATGISLEIRQWNPGNGFDLVWPVDGGLYQVESTISPLNPESWNSVPGNATIINSQFVLPMQGAVPNEYFRLRALP